VALDCARLNVIDPRAQFIWADALAYKTLKPWDMVVMNPPFHAGREAEASLGMGFIKAAHRGLLPSGQLFMVANRHLPYDKLLVSLFKQVEVIASDSAFTVTRAAYPIRGK
jgi:16S rRNA (guanine1207-N2)-methyltransferase